MTWRQLCHQSLPQYGWLLQKLRARSLLHDCRWLSTTCRVWRASLLGSFGLPEGVSPQPLQLSNLGEARALCDCSVSGTSWDKLCTSCVFMNFPLELAVLWTSPKIECSTGRKLLLHNTSSMTVSSQVSPTHSLYYNQTQRLSLSPLNPHAAGILPSSVDFAWSSHPPWPGLSYLVSSEAQFISDPKYSDSQAPVSGAFLPT